MDNPLISVIVPVYKVEKYLDRCVESIVNQTYTNLEIILVDDGSPDNCPAMCDAWAEKDNRIKVIHKENGGVSSARNAGLDMLTGALITFIDADDWVEKDYFDSILKIDGFQTFDMVVTSFAFDYINGDTKIINIPEFQCAKANVLKEYLLDSIRPEACGKVFKKAVLNGVRFNTNYGYAEDLLFNYELLKNCNSLKCVNIHKYHYLQQSGNSSTTAYITDNRARSYRVFEYIADDCKTDSELYTAAVWRLSVTVLAVLSRVLTDEDYSKKYYNQIVDSLLKYKNDIIRNKKICFKHKTIIMMLSVNRQLFYKVVTVLRRKNG